MKPEHYVGILIAIIFTIVCLPEIMRCMGLAAIVGLRLLFREKKPVEPTKAPVKRKTHKDVLAKAIKEESTVGAKKRKKKKVEEFNERGTAWRDIELTLK